MLGGRVFVSVVRECFDGVVFGDENEDFHLATAALTGQGVDLVDWVSSESVAAQTAAAPVQLAESFPAGRRHANREPREEFVKVLRSLATDRPKRFYSLCRELRSRHLLIETRKWTRNHPRLKENLSGSIFGRAWRRDHRTGDRC